MKLSEDEMALINLYSRMPTSWGKRLNIWLVELVPPAVLVAWGVYKDQEIYLVAAIAALVFFNVFRLYRQESHVKTLQALCAKLEASYGALDSNET